MYNQAVRVRFEEEQVAAIRKVYPTQAVSEAIRKAVQESLDRHKAKQRKRLRK